MSAIDFLINKYGLRLNMLQVSEVLDIPYKTIINKRSSGKLKLRTYKDGLKVYSDSRDVAAYLDEVRDGSK